MCSLCWLGFVGVLKVIVMISSNNGPARFRNEQRILLDSPNRI